MHVYGVLIFVILGGVLASLNHTRYDLGVDNLLFHVRYHDEHHVVFNTNYSQYTVLWDMIWGTFSDLRDRPTARFKAQ